ncbi:hypothetical protein LINPERHAP2_LOCUS4324, partial [Linum perenne]
RQAKEQNSTDEDEGIEGNLSRVSAEKFTEVVHGIEFELRKHQHSRLKKQGSQLEAQAQAFVSVSPKGIHRLREAPEAVKLISKQVAAGHTSPSLLHLREL